MGYLEQEPRLDNSKTVLEVVQEGVELADDAIDDAVGGTVNTAGKLNTALKRPLKKKDASGRVYKA